MENPFKKILQDEKLPDKLRERVMADIALINLSKDMIDLFGIKFPKVFLDPLNIDRNDDEDQDDESESIDEK